MQLQPFPKRAYRGRSIKKFQPRSFIFPRFTSKHFNVKKMDMNRKTNEISPCLLVFLVQHAYNLQFIFIQFQTNSYMNPRGTMHHLQWYYYKGRNWPATSIAGGASCTYQPPAKIRSPWTP
ncbi:uncharacterized protein LOC126666992 isoform X4 [Mercurialis annua]|uniref:uncharacterized protein LOC126666992 isoform X4 n=1 Tax=Mercurialis annua TaxID=3986 RepID=UPI00215E13CF|nr:uncharacterized protein LOC126666992 isoform X4 [Mercurialis annua]